MPENNQENRFSAMQMESGHKDGYDGRKVILEMVI